MLMADLQSRLHDNVPGLASECKDLYRQRALAPIRANNVRTTWKSTVSELKADLHSLFITLDLSAKPKRKKDVSIDRMMGDRDISQEGWLTSVCIPSNSAPLSAS